MNQKKITYFHSTTHKIEVVFTKDLLIKYPLHNHVSNYVIGFVQSGQILLTRLGIPTIIHENDFFVIPPYEPHMIEAVCETFALVTVCVSTDFVSDNNFESALPILGKLADTLVAMELISAEQLAIFSKAIGALFSSVITTKEPPTKEIITARDYLEQAADRAISLDQLSQSVYISKYHFLREFKKNVGLTPHNFQLQNRIRKAQHLLAANSNLTEVALSAGFYDQSHFIKCFKKNFGITPTEYLLAVADLPQ